MSKMVKTNRFYMDYIHEFSQGSRADYFGNSYIVRRISKN
jgi:hypothetical protein